MCSAAARPHLAGEGAAARHVWLNVASSVDVLEGYVNLDNGFFYRLSGLVWLFTLLPSNRYTRAIELRRQACRRARVVFHDCRTSLPYAAESVDHVLCSHFLEHVYPDEAAGIVRDFHRVLRPGGTVHLIVPNLRYLAERYVADVSRSTAASRFMDSTHLTSRGRPSWRFRLLEMLGYEGLKHRWMYDADSLEALLLSAGFRTAPLAAVPSAAYRAKDGDASAHAVGIKRAT